MTEVSDTNEHAGRKRNINPTRHGACFECGAVGKVHDHHVVPEVRGGTRTIPLCEEHHSLVHFDNALHYKVLMAEGTKKWIAAGRPRKRRDRKPLQEHIASLDMVAIHLEWTAEGKPPLRALAEKYSADKLLFSKAFREFDAKNSGIYAPPPEGTLVERLVNQLKALPESHHWKLLEWMNESSALPSPQWVERMEQAATAGVLPARIAVAIDSRKRKNHIFSEKVRREAISWR
jgi:hypothetical protein